MTIGVVIRTLDEADLIGRCLETLSGQRGTHELDVLVVDSGSTDATVEIAQAHGARVIHIAPADFDYSKALNLGIEQVGGELVVILSAHAIPLDDRWLERMAAPFSDARVAGVSSGQVTWPGAPWWEVARVQGIFGAERRVYTAGDAEDMVFSNAASCIRRSAWQDMPFTLPAAEDLDWSQRAVAAGLAVVYEPEAAVYHSHDEPPRAQARRMIDINRAATGGEARTLRRTVREAAGLLYRNAQKIVRLDEPLRRKAAYMAELVQMVWFYVIDFSQAGSTAERRRGGTRTA